MSSCVASYYGKDVKVYSLRDKFNNPHCTMEKDQQIKGKGNGDIDPKYVGYVVKFLEISEMTVGENEMNHLGYVDISGIKDKNAVFSNLYDKKWFFKRNKVLDKDGKEYQSVTLWEKFRIFDLDLNLNINWNFDIALSVKTFLAKCNSNSAASNTGDNSAASNTGDNSAASNTGYQSAASNTGNHSAASNTGDYSAASNTGYRSAASNTGDYSAASNTGNNSAASNTGDYSAASNTGNYSAASNTGNHSAASNTGDYSAASNTGDYSAASNTGDRSAASNTGDYSAASNTGYRSAASNTGYYSAALTTGFESRSKVEKETSVAISSGRGGAASGKINCWLILVERDIDWNILDVKSIKVDGKKIKEDVYYKLEDNKFVEVK